MASHVLEIHRSENGATGRVEYAAHCSCGWWGPQRDTQAAADEDRVGHVTMRDETVLSLLRHLEPEPRLVAVTADEVAVLRSLGYVEQRGLRLTDAGRARLAAES